MEKELKLTVLISKIEQFIYNFVHKNYFLIGLILSYMLFIKVVVFAVTKLEIGDYASIYDSFRFLFFPFKICEIIMYLIGAFSCFIYFLIFLFKVKDGSYTKYLSGDVNSRGLSILVLILSFYDILTHIIKTKNVLIIALFFLSWLLANYIIFNRKLISFLSDKLNAIYENVLKNYIPMTVNAVKKYYVSAITVVFCLILFLQIAPFVFGKLKVINEFTDIPETTYIKKSPVDNDEFIEKNHYYNYVRRNKKDGIMEEFTKLNRMEIHWQNLSRWVLFHHSHILVPINELELHKDKSQIFAQYGWINSFAIGKLLKVFGSINYQTYFKVYFSFFYIYYFAGFLIVSYLLKDKILSLLWLVSVVTSLNVYNFYYVYLAPGCNPIRHFFDLPAVLFLYKYFNNGGMKYLIFACLFIIFAILNNWQMGIFLFAALCATVLIKAFVDKNFKGLCKELYVLIPFGVLALASIMIANIGVDYTKEYFVQGLLGWILHTRNLFSTLNAVLLAYVVFSLLQKSNSPVKYVFLFMIFYIQGILLYWIWASDAKHFMVILPVITFGILLMIKFIFDNIGYEKIKFILKNVLLIYYSFFAIIGSIKYYKNYNDYCKIFKKHVTYEWKLPRANFVSTMNPKYFTDSVDLIRKYSNNENAVYIISKYDFFLTFLAEKYSNMPFLNLEWYILSDKELQKSIDCIKENKPEILYVDKNIMFKDSKHYPVYHYLSYLSLEKQAHIDRIKNLEKVFDAVKSDYKKIDESYLLSVYKLVPSKTASGGGRHLLIFALGLIIILLKANCSDKSNLKLCPLSKFAQDFGRIK